MELNPIDIGFNEKPFSDTNYAPESVKAELGCLRVRLDGTPDSLAYCRRTSSTRPEVT